MLIDERHVLQVTRHLVGNAAMPIAPDDTAKFPAARGNGGGQKAFLGPSLPRQSIL